MFCKFYIILCLMVFAVCGAVGQEISPRIAGLESNAEYMDLLREDEQLQLRADSTVNAVENLRNLLRKNPEKRQQYSKEILILEGRIFDLRNAKGRLVDRINTIEQDWVLTNLNSGVAVQKPTTQEAVSKLSDSLKVRNLIDNLYFREHLPQPDYEALRKAQMQEKVAVDYINRYFANYEVLAGLAEQYAAVQTETEAVDIYDKYNVIRGFNQTLSDSLSGVWNSIFDNKTYAYGYLLDKLGQDVALAREEEVLSDVTRQLSELRGVTASDAVADYFLRKKIVADYEMVVADLLGLTAARDSLKGVSVQVGAVNFRLPKIELEERYFLDYDSISFSPTPRYTYQNPIPECKIYARGTIYRIQLGTFSTKRPVSVFRGVYPLCYQMNDENKWIYFAGGFATLAEAEVALKELKSKGFVRPEMVVWTDGVYRNLSREPQEASLAYRVEIMGVQSLSDAVKAAIAATAEGCELSRVGQQMYVVGLFDDKALAERVAAALTAADSSLEIKIAEITEESK